MASYTVSNGVISSGVALAYNDSMTVMSDGKSIDTLVQGSRYYNSTYVNVQNGGSAVKTHILFGHLDVQNGGYAESTTVDSNTAYVNVVKGGRTNSTTVKNGGALYVSAGGTATNVNIASNGVMFVDVDSNSYITGTSNGKTVKVGDEVTSNITLYNYHSMFVRSGWRAYDTVVQGSTYYNSTYVNVQNGGSAIRTLVHFGHLDVQNGGYADSTTVDSNTAYINVVKGGHANSTTVKNGGVLYVSAGGSATKVNIASNGVMFVDVDSDSYITGTSNGKTVKVGDEVTSNITLYNYHSMFVRSGWRAYDTVVQGSTYYNSTYVNVQNGGSAIRTLVHFGHLDVMNGGYANSTTVDSNTAYVNVVKGGHANSTTVNNGGVMYVSAGGSATNVNISSDGVMFVDVDSNSCITGTSNGKTVKVGDKVTSNITLYNYHSMFVRSDWTAYDTVIQGSSYYNSTYVDVMVGGSAVNTLIKFGHLDVMNGGYAVSTTVDSNTAYLQVAGGGRADSTALKNGGIMYANGAQTRNTTIETNGAAYISGYGVESGAIVKKNGHLYLGKNGSAAARGSALSVTVLSGGNMTLYTSSYAADVTVLSGGSVQLTAGAVLGGNITIGGRLTATGAVQAANARIDLDLTARTPDDNYIIGGMENLTNGRFAITVGAGQQSGEYQLTNAAAAFAGSFTVETNSGATLGNISVGGTLVKDGYSLALFKDDSSRLVLNVTAPGAVGGVRGDLDGDGRADIVMTITQAGHGAYGATGAWMIQRDQTAAWGDLSQRNSGWEIFGLGTTAAGKTTNDIYVKNSGNVIGAWTTDASGKVTGWQTVGQFDATTRVLGLGDFNGDGQTDLLLRNNNGAVGCYFTSGDKTGWNYFQSLGDEWTIAAVGDFNGDGRDDVVLKHDAGFTGSWLTQADSTMEWADLGTLENGFTIVGAGDFDGNGTDDVLLQNGGYVGAWIVENGNVSGWMGLGDIGSAAVEQVGDFDADGKDDLRIRTAAGDIGAMIVDGADNLSWKYYGSVGREWSTSLAAI